MNTNLEIVITMKCFKIVTIIILLIKLSNSYLTPPMATERYVEQEIIEMNPKNSNDTLIFAQVVSSISRDSEC